MLKIHYHDVVTAASATLRRSRRSRTASTLVETSALLVGSLVLAVLILHPMLRLGFIADDLGMSVSAGMLGLLHMSVWSEIYGRIVWWLHAEGRFFPAPFIYSYLFFALNPSMQAEKCVQLAAVLVNVATLYYMMQYVAGVRVAAIVSLFFVACLQVRSWFDAIVAFFILLPVTTEALLLCFWFLIVGVHRRSEIRMILAAIFGTFALLSYEMTYPIVVAIGLSCAIAAKAIRYRLASLALTIGPVACLTTLDWALRRSAQPTNYAIAWDGGAYIRTFAEQLVAAIPLTFATFTQRANVWIDLRNARPSVILAAVLAAAISYFVLRRRSFVHQQSLLISISFGAALWLFPAAVISLSHPLQIRPDHTLGNGYLNVYIESAGVAVLGGVLLVRYFEVITSRTVLYEISRMAAAVSIGTLTALTGAENDRAFETYIPVWTTMRSNLDVAFAGGLTSAAVRDSARRPATMYWDSPYPLSATAVPYEIYANSHEAFMGEASDVSNLHLTTLCKIARYADGCSIRKPVWVVRANVNARVSALRLARLHRYPNGTVTPIVDRWYTAGDAPDGTVVSRFAAQRLPGSHARPVYQMSSCMGTRMDEVNGDAIPSNIVFAKGFSGQEAAGDDLWRWSQARAMMKVEKFLPVSAKASIRFMLQTLGASQVKIDTRGSHIGLMTKPGVETPVTIPVDLRHRMSAEIRFHTVGGTLQAPGDPRELGLRISNISLKEVCE